MQTLTAFQNTEALKAAIELDIFTKIGEGASEPADIAAKVGAAERGVRILCDFLTIQGFLKKSAGRYELTPESAMFLDRRSPASMTPLIGFYGTPEITNKFKHLAESVRRGGTAHTGGDNTKPNDERWVAFARSMAPMMVPAANFMAELLKAEDGQPMKVLDIAAGHGAFGVMIARKNPQASITALDWAPVLEVAKENAQAAGVEKRYSTRPGSAFDAEMGNGYDVALLTNFLHHFDPPTCEQVLRRVHAALKPGGRALTLDLMPNDDRVTPPMAAAFSLTMLATTDHGDAYTPRELEQMFRNAGFARSAVHAVPNTPQSVMISEKAG